MSPEFQRLMNEATRLTQTGDLRAATAAIQNALFGGQASAHQASHDDGDVIEVEAREVPDRDVTSGQATARPDASSRHDQRHTARPSADAGRFIAGSFQNSAGQRNYKLYVPPGAGTQPMPLVVMLHGCTQNPDDFAAGTEMNQAAQEQGFFVLYPEQSTQANPQRCWNWFKHNHQVKGRGEPAMLEGMTREVMATYAIDAARVYVAGLSAGGAMAAILGDAYPELYSAVGVHSGLAAGVASDLSSALAAMKGQGRVVSGAVSGMPTIVFHGDADATVHAGNGQQVIAASVGIAARQDVLSVAPSGGRGATRHVHRDRSDRVVAEHWVVHGAGHAWSGGSSNGSYADASGPSATQEMLRFFFEHPRRSGMQ
ncbi:PHB depolymerase family esterase [Pigmentiphaga aceris]|uniref:PHB depolymerase family esterase n=1 Tax=Pigmentiphaga aceris TaxID=1940612 RepID=A0A5C0B5B9_9BURK|nr:PHB depolymerase family esterase [Pigmentiphaga aceris]QEI08863.1 PHB depolymerase family esterase [Pigmentiphaga aceris]